MSKDVLTSPILIKYLEAYKKNPQSRVFAPLAESYRKLGRIDKALEVLKAGIKYHPTYVMGYLGLAACYYDINQQSLAYATLRPLVAENRDNLRLQKLFGQICIEMGLFEEALETFKYLLFVNPKDQEAALHVKQLEGSHEPKKSKISQDVVESKLFGADELAIAPFEEGDDWVHMDLTKSQLERTTSELNQLDEIDDEEENFTNEPLEVQTEVVSEEKENLTLQPALVSADDGEDEFERPLMTHTLVDLYFKQGLYSKAKEILDCILEQNPNDLRTRDRLFEVNQAINKYGKNASGLDEGRDDLMSFFDSKIKMEEIVEETQLMASSTKYRDDKASRLEHLYNKFLEQVQQKFSYSR